MIENSIEKKDIKIELTSEDGLFIWREIDSSGVAGDWKRTGINTSNKNGLIKLMDDLKGKYGPDSIKQ